MNTNLGNRIKNLRNERHLSQEYVAEQIGVSRQSVSKWESGISRPSTGNLICLAELFDVSLDAFTQEAPDNSGNVKKRKDISKTLKIIVCTILGICILHFIIWASLYGMCSLKGDVFAECNHSSDLHITKRTSFSDALVVLFIMTALNI